MLLSEPLFGFVSREGGPGKGQQSLAANPPAAAGVRQSPRLNRKRPNGGGDASDTFGTAQKSAPGRTRTLPAAASTTAAPAAAFTPSRGRRGTASTPASRTQATGVLVGETPQKLRGGCGPVAVAGGARSSGRRDGRSPRVSIDDSPAAAATCGAAAAAAASPASPRTAAVAARTASRKSLKRLLPEEEARAPGSPSLLMGSPAAGPKKRRRAAAAGPPGPASPGESLFVAESPGLSTGSARRSGRAGWAAGGLGDGVSRQLISESASPVGRRQGGAVVPGTPA